MGGGARRWLRRAHLALALACGLVLVAVAGSGTLIAFRDQLRAAPALSPPWDGTDGIGFAAARDRARAERPDHQLQILWFPTRARPWYEAAFAQGERRFIGDLRLHPHDGSVLPGAPDGDWLETVETFHVNLLLGDTGAWITRFGTLLALPLVLTGVVLWWPGWRPRLWFALRRGRGLLAFDLHRVVGVVATPVLLVLIVTGLVWSFPAQTRVLAHLLSGRLPPAAAPDPFAARSSPPVGTPATDVADEVLLAEAVRRAPADAIPFYITFPIQPDEARQVRLQQGYEPWPYGTVYRYFYDRYDGSLIGAVDERTLPPAERFLERWTAPLHFGTWGGWPTLGLWAAVSATPVLLAITGSILWRRRKMRACTVASPAGGATAGRGRWMPGRHVPDHPSPVPEDAIRHD